MLTAFRKYFLQKSSSTNLQIDSLDGLRGIALLFVLFSHMSAELVRAVPGLNFSQAGRYGVYLFFVLSAFLLTLPIISRPTSQFTDVGLWVRYFVRRFLRIFPPYIIVLLINCTFFSIFGLSHFFPLNFKEAVLHIALRLGYSVFWTIPVEFKYYFLLPLVGLFLVAVVRKRISIAIISMLAAICLIIFAARPGFGLNFRDVSLFPYLPIFLMGSLTAFLHSSLAEVEGLKKASVKTLFEIIAVVAFILILIAMPHYWSLVAGDYSEIFNPQRQFTIIGALWSLFLFSYLNGRGYIRRILESSFFRFVGVVSFSAYLWHIPVISFIKTWSALPALIMVGLIILATLAVAATSHLLFERPFMRADLNKWFSKIGIQFSS